MNIISKLTFRHLKENKKRTIVTILGIAASTALITTMLVGVMSFFHFFGQVSIIEDGHWEAMGKNMTKQQVEELAADDRIKGVSVADTALDITGIRVKSDATERNRLSNILHLDTSFIQNKVVSTYEGTLPQKADEVAVEQRYLERNHLDLHVGDPITVELGMRYTVSPEGKEEAMGGNYRSNELFKTKSEETYTITAILHDNTATSSYDMIRCLPDDYFPEENIIGIHLKKLNIRSYQTLQQIAKDHNISYEGINSEFLISVFSFNHASRGVSSIIPVGFAALLIIIGTSVVLIYNAFGMSLAEKMRYLGMLASVGATKKQKRKSIYFEGLLLGIVGIPLGILLGYLGAYVTLAVLGERIIDSGMVMGVKNYINAIHVHAPWWAYVMIAGLAALTIFISAMVPALRASKVMPVDAIRQTGVIKSSARKLRTNPLVKKVFGYEGELAYKNIKRNGKKGTIITLSIAISVAMFLSIMHFCDNVQKLNNYDWNLPYQVIATCSESEGENLKDALKSMREVEDFYPTNFIEFHYRASKDNPEEVLPNDAIMNTDFLEDDYKHVFDYKTILACYIPDEDFDAMLVKNHIDPAPYHQGELKGVILDAYNKTGKEGHVFKESIIGQRLFYDEQGTNPPAIEIAGIVKYDKDNYVFDLLPKMNVTVYIPESVFAAKEKEILGDDATTSYAIVTEEPEKVYEDIMEMFETEEYHKYYAADLSSSMAAMSTVMLLLKTCMYGFTTLITMIALANMVNTIYTGIILRRKEFAMYRSVGMTEKGFKRMIALETILYGIRSLFIGLPLAVCLSYAMTRKANSIMKFQINVGTYLIAIVAVFAIVGLSMLMSVSKIKNDEIIEVLKEDIC